jgi:hypothetical protein
MKKLSLIFLVLYLFTSCDPPAYYDYYIINQCDEEIDVYIESNSKKIGDTYRMVIQAYENKLIYSDEIILALSDRMIEYFFEEIIIIKGSDTSKVNYVNKDLWKFEIISKDHANSYLTVTDKDFEQ